MRQHRNISPQFESLLRKHFFQRYYTESSYSSVLKLKYCEDYYFPNILFDKIRVQCVTISIGRWLYKDKIDSSTQMYALFTQLTQNQRFLHFQWGLIS